MTVPSSQNSEPNLDSGSAGSGIRLSRGRNDAQDSAFYAEDVKLLVTGAAGYIGSHTCVELMAQGHELIGLDNYANSNPEAINRVQELADGPMLMEEVDLLDAAEVERVFRDHQPDAVSYTHLTLPTIYSV